MSSDKRSVTVFGLGYIGLPTASLLATRGYQVHGVDVRPEVVETINHGELHFVEPELDVLVRSAVQSGRLRADTEPAAADVFLIAVPTPFKAGNKPDLDYVEAASRSMAAVLEPGNLVILESTSPVGTTERVAEWIAEARPDLPAGAMQVAHCPERVLPGRIIQELVENDRVVGGLDDAATEAAASFYREFVSGAVLPTTARTAEMAKLTENTYRDVNIALANELSLICDRLAIDVWELTALANRHPRVNVLQPGPGVGGHCIAVDPWFIVDAAPEEARLIRAAREVNDAKPEQIVTKVAERVEQIRGPVIACLGLAYKPDVDDLRESPALRVVELMSKRFKAELLVVEPNIDVLPEEINLPNVTLESINNAIEKTNIVVVLVRHKNFLYLKHELCSKPNVIDVCGLLANECC